MDTMCNLTTGVLLLLMVKNFILALPMVWGMVGILQGLLFGTKWTFMCENQARGV